MVQGDRDNFGPEEQLRAAAVSWSKQVSLAVIEGADHFFEQHLPQLRQRVVGFLRGA